MKKVIIIGATSGMGRELAEKLCSEGCKVGITGRRVKLLEEIRQEVSNAIEIEQMDVTVISELACKLDNLKDRLGGLDLLVISSGTGELNPNLEFPLDRLGIDVNVTGFTYLAN